MKLLFKQRFFSWFDSYDFEMYIGDRYALMLVLAIDAEKCSRKD